MDEEMKKRLEEAAKEYIKQLERRNPSTEAWNFDGAFIAGAEWMFKECGGMTVLKDMRRLILAQCKEWLKWNAQPKYIFIEDGQPWIDNAKLLADFEADMTKLWEEKK